ncbi:MAG: 4-vinyl reductase [Clostridiales bacterium]|jgi:predicted hydrocarbon binding protein|nr:4-vinyl reductase [Clostridiales bacterium]
MRYKEKPSKFTWESMGDIKVGRGNLGSDMPVMVYRLMQYTMRDILHREYDEETARNILWAAGHLAGINFAENVLDLSGDFDFFVANLHKSLIDYKIGILRIERSDLDSLNFTLTVSEDLDCSGLPITDETVCDYDEGFISGIFETYTGKEFNVKEIDCWATGDRTCRFKARPSVQV